MPGATRRAGVRPDRLKWAILEAELDRVRPVVESLKSPEIDARLRSVEALVTKKRSSAFGYHEAMAQLAFLKVAVADATSAKPALYEKYGGTAVKFAGEEYLVLTARDRLITDELTVQEATPTPHEAQPAEDPITKELLLGRFALALDAIAEAQQLARDLVRDARAAGATWREIGEIGGTTPQGAYNRWDDAGRERHARNERDRRAQQRDG